MPCVKPDRVGRTAGDSNPAEVPQLSGRSVMLNTCFYLGGTGGLIILPTWASQVRNPKVLKSVDPSPHSVDLSQRAQP